MTEPARPSAADQAPGSRLLELVQVMDTLRRNCPWDARQTHHSLTPHLLEETYEAVDALTADDQAAVCEELGDVLLQVVFHARVVQERTDDSPTDAYPSRGSPGSPTIRVVHRRGGCADLFQLPMT